MGSGFGYIIFLIRFICLFSSDTCKSVDYAVIEELHEVEYFNYQKDTILDQHAVSAETVLKSEGIDATGHKILGMLLLLLLLLSFSSFCVFYLNESSKNCAALTI